MWRAVLMMLLLTAPALAQQSNRATAWRALTGADAGAVGTCHRLDDDETLACLILRCHATRGLELVYRHGSTEPEPTRFEIAIGRYRTSIDFTRASPTENVLRLTGREDLLNAMRSAPRGAQFDMLTRDPTFSYSTSFLLQNAGPMIARVRQSCRN